ncbi:MAG: hypothetical protein ABW068_15510 [Candidatus Thiodiazotropha sp.]
MLWTSLADDADPALSSSTLVDILYAEADRAMYDAKERGRNQRIIHQN